MSRLLRWLGGNIDIKLRVGTGLTADDTMLYDEGQYDINTYGSSDIAWQDFTPRLLSATTKRGQARWESRFEVGTASLMLDNSDGALTPGSGHPGLGGLQWRPGRVIQLVALPDPSDPELIVPLFTGRITDSKDEWQVAGAKVIAKVEASDAMDDWRRFNPLALSVATGVQSTSDRIEAALDRIGWDVRDIQTGEHTMQTSFLAQSVLEECQRAAEAEGGAFFSGPEGEAVFKARDWLSTDTRSTVVQGYIGYEPDEVPEGAQVCGLTGMETSWELARVYNTVQFSRTGGSVYEVTDGFSAGRYGPATRQDLDFQNALNSTGEAEVEFLADRFLAAFKEHRLRIDSVSIGANRDDGNQDLNRLYWDTQIGDLMAVKAKTLTGWQIETLSHVVSIEDTITGTAWTRRFRLDDAATWFPDDSSSSS